MDFERSLEEQHVAPRILVFSNSKGLRHCLYKGVGLSLCPEVAVRDEIERGALVRLPWEEDGLETSVLMIWHADKWCSPLLTRFMELAREIMGGGD